jgi:hypothetical protein
MYTHKVEDLACRLQFTKSMNLGTFFLWMLVSTSTERFAIGPLEVVRKLLSSLVREDELGKE